MNKQETLAAIESALNDFLENDFSLLENNVSERAISHKLAEYLSDKFSDFDVDCEYNRHIRAIKDLEITERDMLNMFGRKINDNDTYSVFPDIIIHERLIDDRNHVIFEIKKNNSDTDDKRFDELKLKKFTEQYGYKLGIYLEFKVNNNCGVSVKKYYQEGEEKEIEELIEL